MHVENGIFSRREQLLGFLDANIDVVVDYRFADFRFENATNMFLAVTERVGNRFQLDILIDIQMQKLYNFLRQRCVERHFYNCFYFRIGRLGLRTQQID